jgi:hypothetical protein
MNRLTLYDKSNISTRKNTLKLLTIACVKDPQLSGVLSAYESQV